MHPAAQTGSFSAMNKGYSRMTGSRRQLNRLGKKALVLLVLAGLAGGLIFADRIGLLGVKPKGDFEKYDGKTFRVTHHVDGDTFDIDIPDGNHSRTRLRLWGVDTPETVKPHTPPQHFGKEASEFVKQQTFGKDVKIELEPGKNPRDKYGRLLAWVTLPDGRLLNRVLVEDGYAYVYLGEGSQYDHHLRSEFIRLQKQAMDAGRGLWKNITPDDLPYYLKNKLRLPNK